jgi:predicted glycosyltransferase
MSKLEVRLHPKNTIEQFDEYAEEIKLDKIIDPLESVWKADFILGMSSNLLVEAMYFGKKVLSILPRYEEKKWMSELEEGLIETVFTREALLRKLNILNSSDNQINENINFRIEKLSFIELVFSF